MSYLPSHSHLGAEELVVGLLHGYEKKEEELKDPAEICSLDPRDWDWAVGGEFRW